MMIIVVNDGGPRPPYVRCDDCGLDAPPAALPSDSFETARERARDVGFVHVGPHTDYCPRCARQKGLSP